MRPYNMHTLTNINMQSIERNVMACRYKIQSRNLPNLVVIQHVEYPMYIGNMRFLTNVTSFQNPMYPFVTTKISNLDNTMVNICKIARVIIF